MNDQDIRAAVKSYVVDEFLPGEDVAALTDDTPLLTSGILDSIAVLKLVVFLEGKFNILLEAHEADSAHLNTVTDIARLVASKLA